MSLFQVETIVCPSLTVCHERAEVDVSNGLRAFVEVEDAIENIAGIVHLHGTLKRHVGLKLQTELFLLLRS